MPIINVTIHKTDVEIKKKLIEQLTKTAAEVTKVRKESFTVILQEFDDQSIGLGGKTLKEFLLTQ